MRNSSRDIVPWIGESGKCMKQKIRRAPSGRRDFLEKIEKNCGIFTGYDLSEEVPIVS